MERKRWLKKAAKTIAWQTLRPNEQAVLRAYLEWPAKKIAQARGISEFTVAQLLRHAQNMLAMAERRLCSASRKKPSLYREKLIEDYKAIASRQEELAKLSPLEQKIIRLSFGEIGRPHFRSTSSVGKECGISAKAVWRVKERALDKLNPRRRPKIKISRLRIKEGPYIGLLVTEVLEKMAASLGIGLEEVFGPKSNAPKDLVFARDIIFLRLRKYGLPLSVIAQIFNCATATVSLATGRIQKQLAQATQSRAPAKP